MDQGLNHGIYGGVTQDLRRVLRRKWRVTSWRRNLAVARAAYLWADTQQRPMLRKAKLKAAISRGELPPPRPRTKFTLPRGDTWKELPPGDLPQLPASYKITSATLTARVMDILRVIASQADEDGHWAASVREIVRLCREQGISLSNGSIIRYAKQYLVNEGLIRVWEAYNNPTRYQITSKGREVVKSSAVNNTAG